MKQTILFLASAILAAGLFSPIARADDHEKSQRIIVGLPKFMIYITASAAAASGLALLIYLLAKDSKQ